MPTAILNEMREAPSIQPMENVVNWSIFRRRSEAEDYIHNIRLGKDQILVGGQGRDSIGPYWWVGVRVQDLEKWGSPHAVHKRDAMGT